MINALGFFREGNRNMINPSRRYRNREPLSNEEIDAMLLEADEIKDDYFRLRAKVLISIAKKFGNARSEIAALERSDLNVEKRAL
jgi:integrase